MTEKANTGKNLDTTKDESKEDTGVTKSKLPKYDLQVPDGHSTDSPANVDASDKNKENGESKPENAPLEDYDLFEERTIDDYDEFDFYQELSDDEGIPDFPEEEEPAYFKLAKILPDECFDKSPPKKPENRKIIPNKSDEKSGTEAREEPQPPPARSKKTPTTAFYRPASEPVLTKQMLRDIHTFMAAGTPSDEIHRRQRFRVRRGDLNCLEPETWLIDTVVDLYMEMIVARNQQRPGTCAKVYIFMSSFYALLSSKKGMSKVEEAANDVNIFEYELLFFPVCHSEHWRLIVVNMPQRSVSTYNSIEGQGDVCIMRNIIRYLQGEYKRRHPPPPRPVEMGNVVQIPPTWDIQVVKDNIPRQNNNYDCGVFICHFADYLSRRVAFNFAVNHMNYYRARMTYECINGRILT